MSSEAGIYDFLQAKKISELNELGRKDAISPSRTNSQSDPSGLPVRHVGPETSSEEDHSQVLTKVLSYAERKEQQKRKNRAEKAVKESEAKIEKMEQRIRELDELLMQPENASDMTLVTEYTSTKKCLDEEVERWEKFCETLESMISN